MHIRTPGLKTQVTEALQFVHDTISNLDVAMDRDIDSVTMDYAKALNMMPHMRLQNKLDSYGIMEFTMDPILHYY